MARDAELDGLLSAAARLSTQHAEQGCSAAGLLADIANHAQAAPANPAPAKPQHLPACRHLATALSLGQHGPMADLVAVVEKIADRLRWVQNPNYVADANMRDFIADYAYAELVGPTGMVISADIALGLLLIGPDKLYPPHRHPAAEVYLAVAGEAAWQRGGEAWQSNPPGALILHEPNVVHAMRTLDQPLLALYAWRGEVNTAARLV